MEKLLWTRCQWAAWEWHHPWAVVGSIALIASVYAVVKMLDR